MNRMLHFNIKKKQKKKTKRIFLMPKQIMFELHNIIIIIMLVLPTRDLSLFRFTYSYG